MPMHDPLGHEGNDILAWKVLKALLLFFSWSPFPWSDRVNNILASGDSMQISHVLYNQYGFFKVWLDIFTYTLSIIVEKWCCHLDNCCWIQRFVLPHSVSSAIVYSMLILTRSFLHIVSCFLNLLRLKNLFKTTWNEVWNFINYFGKNADVRIQ